MAAIRCSVGEFVITSGSRVYIFKLGEKSEFELQPAAKDEAKQKNKEKCRGKGDSAETPDTLPNHVLACAYSTSGRHFVICDNDKQLHLFECQPKWRLKSVRSLNRRCTSVLFNHNEEDILVADRAGDVYRFSVLDCSIDGELLYGHLSMLLDLVMTPDERFIVSCDRDEKIRVCHYPNAYNIHSFCLGHSKFVSQLFYVEEFNCLVSGSGDGCICCWNLDGQEVGCVKCQRSEVTDDEDIAVKQIVYDKTHNILAAAFYQLPIIHLYILSKAAGKIELRLLRQLNIQAEPWSITFDLKHRLWVLQPEQEAVLKVFTFSKDDSKQFQVTETIEDSDTIHIVETLQKDWDFFKASLDIPSLYSLLQSQKVDNMKSYLEKKESKMLKNKEKKTVPEQLETEPPNKKTKCEETDS